MTIRSIKIEKLFEIFDYDASFNNNENVLIIAGANGFGKTTILNIISNLFNRKFLFFQKLVFEKITINLDDNISIVISKKVENNEPIVKFTFAQNDETIETINYSSKVEKKIERLFERSLPVSKMDFDRWIDHRSEISLTTDDLINKYADQLPDEIIKKVLKIKQEKTILILDSIKVHLIREQRLFRKVLTAERDYSGFKEKPIMMETIQSYANELRELIAEYSQKSFKISQELDSTYPKRLISETARVTEDEYNVRFNELKEKQNKLEKNNLYEIKQENLGYSEADSKALLVYLNDLERKLGVFDDLLVKLELFTGILNERRFTHKTIEIDSEIGFYFKTITGKKLELIQLSSGEQHEVVLLY